MVIAFFSNIFYTFHCNPFLLMMILSWSTALNMYSKGTFLYSCNLSKLFLLLFIIYPQYLLSWMESNLEHPHWYALPFFKLEKTCLSTTLSIWEVYVRNDGTEISSSSFLFDDLGTCPRAPFDWWFITAQIFWHCHLQWHQW